MIRFRSLVAVLCLLLILPTAGFAQEQANEPDEETKALGEKAYEMLYSIAESVPSLRSSDNRIYLSAAVAELLWTKDETRARRLFETLIKEINTVIAGLDPSDQQSLNALGMMQQQRREIIERICRRDPDMALAFLRATRPPDEMLSRTNDFANENNLELYVVSQLAQKEPQRALKLARASLKKGMTYSLVSVLLNIASKNPEAAKTLHIEMVERLKSEDLMANYEPANSAWGLLGAFQPPQADEDAYRGLVELLANCVLSVKPDARSNNLVIQNFSSQVPNQMSLFEKYAPARAAALKQWSQQVTRTMDPGARMYQELNEVAQKGAVDDVLALAEKYGPEQRLQIYQQAAQKALNGGDANRARQIITEFVADGLQRRQMLDQLDNQLFWNAVNQNKVAEARQVLERVKNPEQRFQLLIALATSLINSKQKELGTAVLIEATELINSMPANSTKIAGQLHLAQAYATVDPQQSMAQLQSVIGLVNQLVNAAATLDGFENSYLKEGEWIKRSYSNIGNLVNNLEQNLAALARFDVEGARTLANQLERPEIKLTAQLEIAQSLLNRGGRGNFTRVSNYHRVRMK